MIILFYDEGEGKLHICSPNDKTKIVDIDDPNVMDNIPNDDLLFVTNGEWFEKRQFREYLEGRMELENSEPPLTHHTGPSRFAGFMNDNRTAKVPVSTQTKPSGPREKKWYIHPTSAGTVRIEDVQTKDEPQGVQMNGKWDFRDIEKLGGMDILEESNWIKVLLAKHKIEVVSDEYYEANKHKFKAKVSPTERALNDILVPVGMKAEDVADHGGLGGGEDVAIPIYVEA